MDEYGFILGDDAIDLNLLDSTDKTLFEKEAKEQEELILKNLRKDYVAFLREYYEADEKLFDVMEELLEESEDQDKLMKILDSL